MSSSVQQSAVLSLVRAAGRIRRQSGGVFCGEGIGASQYNILRILRGEGQALAIMTIRDRMLDPEPSITRLIDRLAERGLIRRDRCPDDRRRVDCTITQEGLEMLDRLDGPIDRHDRELVAGLTEAELRTLSVLLDRIGDPE